jgi:hypothetical protein
MRLPLLALCASLVLFGCDSNDDDDNTPRTFTVTIENVSTPGTIDSPRAMGIVPLSPPAYAVFDGDDPMFTEGQMANEGTERIAEDGFPDAMVALLSGISRVTASGAAPSPGGPMNNPALFNGESVTITVTARPGQRFQFETMFVQSNDWFYAFDDGGLDLFDDNDPISGDVTSRLVLYDAGTEEDTAPGTGPTAPPGPVQKTVQDPMATDVGTDESVTIQEAADRHSFDIPANNQVIRVTVQSQ